MSSTAATLQGKYCTTFSSFTFLRFLERSCAEMAFEQIQSPTEITNRHETTFPKGTCRKGAWYISSAILPVWLESISSAWFFACPGDCDKNFRCFKPFIWIFRHLRLYLENWSENHTQDYFLIIRKIFQFYFYCTVHSSFTDYYTFIRISLPATKFIPMRHVIWILTSLCPQIFKSSIRICNKSCLIAVFKSIDRDSLADCCSSHTKPATSKETSRSKSAQDALIIFSKTTYSMSIYWALRRPRLLVLTIATHFSSNIFARQDFDLLYLYE